ncbi:MAG: hypothetical protein ACLFSY_06000 [Desulfonatronovibrionaceae bacterium]
MRILLFVLAVTFLGIWIEEVFGRVEAFMPAFLLLLKYERTQAAAWSLVWWTFLQEGVGSLAFGAMFLFLAGVWMLFHAGSKLFERDNIFFMGCMLILAVFWQRLVMWTISGLQDIEPAFSLAAPGDMLVQLWVYLVLFIVYSAGFNRLVPGK